jgi:hypothetical protein
MGRMTPLMNASGALRSSNDEEGPHASQVVDVGIGRLTYCHGIHPTRSARLGTFRGPRCVQLRTRTDKQVTLELLELRDWHSENL